LLGLDILGTLDIAATDGLATILAEPNLTALSGETASFLAGGEFPIPISQGNNAVTIEYKQYGVGLAFTPVVLADGRISMRVRPEVSQLSDAGAVNLANFRVPALITRRAETTVELGSGQSFMIAGLLQNTGNNSVDKTPFLGDLPVLGMLFRSTKFQRQETEVVVIVTPYLVRPVSGQLATPIDGYRSPNDLVRDIGGQTFSGVSGDHAPTAIAAPALPAPAGGAVPAPGFRR
jgi:pilus assembly protein CpaC